MSRRLRVTRLERRRHAAVDPLAAVSDAEIERAIALGNRAERDGIESLTEAEIEAVERVLAAIGPEGLGFDAAEIAAMAIEDAELRP